MPLSRRFMSLMLVAATLLAACGGAPPPPTPTPAVVPSTAIPGQPASDIPAPPVQAAPTLVSRSPERGEALDPGAPIDLVFDRPMDQASVAAALSVAGVAGAVTWPDARTARFVPSTPLQRAATYDLTLAGTAKAADGTPLAAPLSFRFATAGFLEVGQVIPADGAADVQPGATITVFFNRPVAPLTAIESQSNLPQPVTFNPPIQGRGEWLNTAIYTFTPAAPLAGGTTYTGRVAAGLVDVTGNPLQSDYSWSFTVARPQVVSADPVDGATLIPLQPPVTMTFNVPVDPASARAAFRLRGPRGDIPGDLAISNATLAFTPSARLAFDTDYTIAVAASLTGSAGGLGMAGDYTATFHTVPLPRVLSTDPADGATDTRPGSGFSIKFNAPIDDTTIMPNVAISPEPTQVYTYFNQFDTTFYIGFDSRPSTDYTVVIGPNIADPYGNRIGQSLTVRYRTVPLQPAANLLTPGFVATYDAGRTPRAALMATNISEASLALYRLPLETLQSREFLAPDGSGPPNGARLVRRWREPISVPRDEPTLVRLNLTENGALLDPGVYLVLLDQPSSPPQGHVLIVSSIHLTLKTAERDALVWANDIANGAPATNLALELYDEQGAQLGQATTGSDGVATATLQRTDNRGLLVVSRQPFAAFAAGWGSGVSPWDFGLQAAYDLPEFTAYIYTDRPIYRPGQQVWFKGALRAENDVQFSIPQGLSAAQLTVFDAAGEQVLQQPVRLNQNGTFDGGFVLAQGAPTGQYSMNLDAGGTSFYFSFQVAAYRPPEIEVNVAPRDVEIIRGASTDATVRAAYFFGAPAADLPVQWRILAEPFVPAPDWAGRYTFGETDGPWVCRFCWWLPPVPPQPILSGSATTDAQGQATIAIPPELRDTQSNVITRSVRLTLEATATGRDNQAISGRSTVVVHAGDLYIGMAPRAYVGQAGDEQQLDLVTIDTDGNRLANRTVEVEFLRTTWENQFVEDAAGGRWESRQVRESVGTQTINTDAKGEAVVSFTPASGGAYLVQARAVDGGGREVRTSLYVWVYGGDAFWIRENNDRINLIADKGEYRPGETATILIPSPFTGAHWALLTIERGGVLSHEVRQVTGGSLVYQLPITAAYAPNIYVSAVLFAPPDGNGAPADYKVGILPLSVVPSAQTLRITVTPAAPKAAPGDTATFDVQVTDMAGAPVSAELSLDLVDKAILTLQPRTPDAIVEAFYNRRALGVYTAASLSASAERFERLLDEQEARQNSAPPGMGGGGPLTVADGEALPSAAAAPMAERAAGAEAPAGLTVREQFADTAFWQAVVTTDAAGKATVQVKLPDNLTTWVMRGVALTTDTRVGEGTGELVSTKPLLIRPVTPRFFVVGDVVQLAANVSNTTGAPFTADVALSVAGLTVSTPLTQTIQIPANGEASASWQVTALDVESADLIFSVVSGQYSDAARPRLASAPEGRIPVYRYSAPETIATGGQLEAAGARTEAIGLPSDVDVRLGELRVRLDPSLAAGILDGLKALEDYPYDSVEATVSRFVPNVVAARALRRLGVSNAELEAELPALVNDALDRLYLWQNGDGGWGWWSSNESNPHITAYVIFGMLRAREAGFTVRDDVMAQGLDYLTASMAAADGASRTDANLQAWLLYVLTDGGRPDTGRIDVLYGNRELLGIYGKSFLALAMHQTNAGDSRLKTLLSDLNTAAIISATGMHWEEAEPYYWALGGDTRSSAIALTALVRLDPQNQIIPNAVRWLMVARRGDIWQTTQESSWALIALTDWMETTGELNGAYDYAVWLNGTERAAGTVNSTNVTSPTLLQVPMAELAAQQPGEGASLLAVGRSDGPGRLYYTAHLNLALPADQVPALDRGIVVTRRYIAADCTDGPRCPEITQAKLGETVRVELSVITERDLYYLRVEDPLPAGGEAIDPNLATTSIAANSAPSVTPQPFERGPWWWWWRWYSRAELRDEKVALFADYLPRGAYIFSYTFRATLPGEYRVIPTVAQEDFFPEVFGRSDGRLFTVTP